MTKRQIKFLIPMIILILGLVVGFTLLAMVYRGNNILESLIIVIVVTIVVFLVKITKKMTVFLGTLDEK